MSKTSKNHRNSTVTPNEINYIWKIIKKYMKNLFMAFPCMFEQLKATVYDNLNKWHLKCLIWGLNLNLGFKPTSFKSLLVAFAQTTACCHVMIMHHIVALHWLCSFCCRCLFFLSKRRSDDVIIDTDEELCYLQKCQASKPPLSILIQSHSLALALFYCIRTTMIQLLLAVVVEPIPLHDLSLPQ
jgi:hypothetical protein